MPLRTNCTGTAHVTVGHAAAFPILNQKATLSISRVQSHCRRASTDPNPVMGPAAGHADYSFRRILSLTIRQVCPRVVPLVSHQERSPCRTRRCPPRYADARLLPGPSDLVCSYKLVHFLGYVAGDAEPRSQFADRVAAQQVILNKSVLLLAHGNTFQGIGATSFPE